MGDRANVAIGMKVEKHIEFVVLYTHWGGHELPGRVQDALKRKERWNDEPYLARIVFDAVVPHNDEPSGYGLVANVICDNEHPIIVIDPGELRFGFCNESETVKAFSERRMPAMFKAWTFDEFTTMTPKKLAKEWRCNREGKAYDDVTE